VRKRVVQQVVRFRHLGKDDLPNFTREQFMLFVLWRDEEAELLSIDPVSKFEASKELILMNSRPFYFSRDIDDCSLLDMITQIEGTESNLQEDNSTIQNELEILQEDVFTQDFVEEPNGLNSRVQHFLPPRIIPDLEYRNLMRSLNDKQRRFVMEVLHLSKTSNTPFYYFLSGGAGVGKSHVITAIVQSLSRYYLSVPSTCPEEPSVIVSAPTAKALNVYVWLSTELSNYHQINLLVSLSIWTIVLCELRNVQLCIIEEISMVSVRQIYVVDSDFGGRSVIVVGHLRQLPPITGSYVFMPRKKPHGKCVGNIL